MEPSQPLSTTSSSRSNTPPHSDMTASGTTAGESHDLATTMKTTTLPQYSREELRRELEPKIHDGFMCALGKFGLRAAEKSSMTDAELSKIVQEYGALGILTLPKKVTLNGPELQFTQRVKAQFQDAFSNLTRAASVVIHTEIAGLLTAGIAAVLAKLAFNMGPHMGNPGGAESVHKIAEDFSPIASAAAILGISTIEEFIFRGVPLGALYLGARFSKKVAAYAPLVGIASATVFALAHNLTSPGSAPGILLSANTLFRVDALPIPQFFFGLAAWHVACKYGFPYAVLAHCAINSVAMIAISLLG